MKKDKASILVKKMLKVCHIKLKKEQEKLLIQIFKFVLVGGIATVIDFVFLYFFREFCHIPVLLSNTLSFSISVIYNYIASVKWVFDVKKGQSKKKQFIVFLLFSILGLLLNNLIMWIMVDFFRVYYLLSKLVATFIVMVFNFITRKLFLE